MDRHRAMPSRTKPWTVPLVVLIRADRSITTIVVSQPGPRLLPKPLL
jgi:hypothetical protein